MGVISLLTDFGVQDSYVGVMKGVILDRFPSASIVDLSHEVSPQSVLEALFLLEGSFPYFPEGSVHLAVVDPGVGSDRKILAVESEGSTFLAPDNGILSARIAQGGLVRAVTNQALWRHPVSKTFHGRDVFAPVAAAIASGIPFSEVGPISRAEVFISHPKHEVTDLGLIGEVVYVDRFGNMMTNMRETDFAQGSLPGEVSIASATIGTLRSAYSDVDVLELLAIQSSFGTLEIACRNGNAAVQLGASVGTQVTWRCRRDS